MDRLSPYQREQPLILENVLVLLKQIAYGSASSASIRALSQFYDLTLADPDPTGIDLIYIIIGADLYASILLHGLRRTAT